MTLIVTFGLLYFCILLLGTISGIFSERVGIVNIAINGFLIFGALMYTIFNVGIAEIFGQGIRGKISNFYQIFAVIFASLMTGVFSLLFGFVTIKLKGEQTISGFAINILSGGITGLLIIVLLKVQSASSSLALPYNGELAWSTDYNNWKNLISFKLFITIAITIAAWFALRKTRWGLRFRSIGENPQAADVAGINVNRKKWQGIIIAGLVAGVGGSIFAQANITEFSITSDVQGLGYISLAIMITSRWKVSISIITSLLFSFMLSTSFYGISLFGSSFEKFKHIIYAVPYVLTLIVICFQSKNSFGPAAAGVPYDKTKR